MSDKLSDILRLRMASASSFAELENAMRIYIHHELEGEFSAEEANAITNQYFDTSERLWAEKLKDKREVAKMRITDSNNGYPNVKATAHITRINGAWYAFALGENGAIYGVGKMKHIYLAEYTRDAVLAVALRNTRRSDAVEKAKSSPWPYGGEI